MTLAMATGRNTFHPMFINWSKRKRGKVPRTQIKTYRKVKTLIENQRGGGIRSRKARAATLGNGRSHPPKKRVTANDETVIMLAYSAMKNSENRKPLYSV